MGNFVTAVNNACGLSLQDNGGWSKHTTAANVITAWRCSCDVATEYGIPCECDAASDLLEPGPDAIHLSPAPGPSALVLALADLQP